jgi:carbamoyl-phosphate synthase large subunit
MIDEDGTPRFIEINARMGGGLPLAVAAGVNIPAMLLQSASNHNVNPVAPGDYEIGLQMTRFDDAFFLSNGK